MNRGGLPGHERGMAVAASRRKGDSVQDFTVDTGAQLRAAWDI